MKIIEMILQFIAISLTAFQLLGKKGSFNNLNIEVQKQLIVQINPQYKTENLETSTGDELKNAKWKATRTNQAVGALIVVLLVLNFLSYIKSDHKGLASFADLYALIYVPIRNFLSQLSFMFIAFCVLFIIRGWEKPQPALRNLLNMKYFSLKILSDLLIIFGMGLVDIPLIEKMLNAKNNTMLSLTSLTMVLLLGVQLNWLRFTINKGFNIEKPATTLADKERQLLNFLPAYIMPLLCLGVILYSTFFI